MYVLPGWTVCWCYAPSLPSPKRSRSSDKSNTARQRVWPSLRYTHSYLPSPALRPTLYVRFLHLRSMTRIGYVWCLGGLGYEINARCNQSHLCIFPCWKKIEPCPESAPIMLIANFLHDPIMVWIVVASKQLYNRSKVYSMAHDLFH